MPVLSISMRPLMGMVQPLARPGTCRAAFIWSIKLLLGNVVRGDVAQHALQPVRAPNRNTRLSRAPLGFGLENDHRFEHRERRGIGGGFGAAGFAEHAVDFGELLEDAVGDLEQASALR